MNFYGTLRDTGRIRSLVPAMPMSGLQSAAKVVMQCRAPDRREVYGPVTGRLYVFEPGGSIAMDEHDADELLRQRPFDYSLLGNPGDVADRPPATSPDVSDSVECIYRGRAELITRGSISGNFYHLLPGVRIAISAEDWRIMKATIPLHRV